MALAYVLIIGEAERFQSHKPIASHLGLVPLEDSSGNRRRLGHITKQRISILRFLLVEAAQGAARSIPQWRSQYFPPDDATCQKDGQGSHDAKTSGSFVLDDA